MRAFAILCIVFGALGADGAPGFIGIALSDGRGGGARVEQVAPGGPAEKAGLKTGDVVVAINGAGIADAAAMTRIITAMAPNATARLSVVRGGGIERLTIAVVVGASGGGAPAAVAGYTRLSDPFEQAFTVEIPAGWRGEGGLVRHAALQIDPYVRALAPDKMTYLMTGEPSMPTFVPPSELGLRLGFREGSLYDSALGGKALVMRYLPGSEFARRYGEIALGSLCGGLKLVSTKERPDLARKADAAAPTVIPSRTEGGEADFSCMHGGREMEGRVEAATRITRDNVYWAAILLQSLLAPKGQADAAHSILNHVADSMKWSQAWIDRQNHLSQQAAEEINRRAQQTLRQEAGFIDKLNSVDESFESMDEIISGTSHYHDAETGHDYSLSNTNPYKWIENSTGRIISTPTNVPPPFGFGYRRLPRTSQ